MDFDAPLLERIFTGLSKDPENFRLISGQEDRLIFNLNNPASFASK